VDLVAVVQVLYLVQMLLQVLQILAAEVGVEQELLVVALFLLLLVAQALLLLAIQALNVDQVVLLPAQADIQSILSQLAAHTQHRNYYGINTSRRWTY
jgi:hypothetical protein